MNECERTEEEKIAERIKKIADRVVQEMVPTLSEYFYKKWVSESSAREGIFYQLDIIFHGFIRAACHIAVETQDVESKDRREKFGELISKYIGELQTKFSSSLKWERILDDLETIASHAREEALAKDD